MIDLQPHHKLKWTPKSIGAIMLTGTVCAVLLMLFIRFMLYPPGTVMDETRDKMFQLVTFIAGVVSGWVLHGEQSQFKDVKEEEDLKKQVNDLQKQADDAKKELEK